jgi:hypothetical protein
MEMKITNSTLVVVGEFKSEQAVKKRAKEENSFQMKKNW